jgi:hypothetical protein
LLSSEQGCGSAEVRVAVAILEEPSVCVGVHGATIAPENKPEKEGADRAP